MACATMVAAWNGQSTLYGDIVERQSVLTSYSKEIEVSTGTCCT